MAGELQGNRRPHLLVSSGQRPLGSSNEDLSEYTDADESVSAPTEFLSEFLSSLMMKDYATALKYCKLILHYEPSNATAREFYPFILEKLQEINLNDENSNGQNTSSDDDPEPNSSHSDIRSESDSEVDISESEKEQLSLEPSFEENIVGLDLDHSELDNSAADKLPDSSKSLSPRIDSDGTTNSYSSLEDEEVVRDDTALEEIVIHNTMDDNNGNIIYTESIVSSVDNDVNFNWFTKRKDKNRNNLEDGPTIFQMSSDSESPTDPVTQQTVEMLRVKIVQATN